MCESLLTILEVEKNKKKNKWDAAERNSKFRSYLEFLLPFAPFSPWLFFFFFFFFWPFTLELDFCDFWLLSTFIPVPFPHLPLKPPPPTRFSIAPRNWTVVTEPGVRKFGVIVFWGKKSPVSIPNPFSHSLSHVSCVLLFTVRFRALLFFFSFGGFWWLDARSRGGELNR